MTATQFNVGDNVPFQFAAGIIIASFFVSLVGSVTTVELLHRRREGKGYILWYEHPSINGRAILTACSLTLITDRLQHLAISVSFGLVAIWCMHFVGNRAITMGDGTLEIQLYYNSGFTALSVFLPIIFLFFGFTTVEFRQPGQRFFWPSLVLAGIIAGLAITGMHYVGNFGISNYKLTNPAGYVVGSAAIACAASVTALSLFFYFKERWINSWMRRLACACLLAGAVSGMHWTATVGTRYTLSNKHKAGSSTSRDTNLIVAIVVVSVRNALLRFR
jgi:NO-binding membrane sensor protein with MHYT domain